MSYEKHGPFCARCGEQRWKYFAMMDAFDATVFQGPFLCCFCSPKEPERPRVDYFADSTEPDAPCAVCGTIIPGKSIARAYCFTSIPRGVVIRGGKPYCADCPEPPLTLYQTYLRDCDLYPQSARSFSDWKESLYEIHIPKGLL